MYWKKRYSIVEIEQDHTIKGALLHQDEPAKSQKLLDDLVSLGLAKKTEEGVYFIKSA
jgi:hypothetical protein